MTFPADYSAANLAGKEATFDVTVKEVPKPGELELNDETAKSLGIEFAGAAARDREGPDREPVRDR